MLATRDRVQAARLKIPLGNNNNNNNNDPRSGWYGVAQREGWIVYILSGGEFVVEAIFYKLHIIM